jgi:hypothetical protein
MLDQKTKTLYVGNMLHHELIARIPNLAALAADCDVSPHAVYGWQRKRHIPSAYWIQVVAHANGLGIAITSLDMLAADLLQHRLKPPRKRAQPKENTL